MFKNSINPEILLNLKAFKQLFGLDLLKFLFDKLNLKQKRIKCKKI